MRVIITGGFGYLGQRIGKYFHDAGSTVFLGSRKQRNRPLWLDNGESFVTDWNNIHLSINKFKSIDLVIHSAGINSFDSLINPEEAIKLSGITTSKLINSCISNQIKNFLYLSTAHVYSSPLEGTISEDSELKNSHPYALSNVSGERYVLQADQLGKINSKILRISNCFGAPMDIDINCWHLIVNDICMQAIKNKQVKLNSDGSQLRDFIPINEFCRTLKFITTNCMEDKNYNIFNIGGKTLSVNEITKIVLDIYENKYNQSVHLIKNNFVESIKVDFFEYNMSWVKKYNFKKIFEPNNEIENLLEFIDKNKEAYRI
jgi:UDP-glucose 4-epimerase